MNKVWNEYGYYKGRTYVWIGTKRTKFIFRYIPAIGHLFSAKIIFCPFSFFPYWLLFVSSFEFSDQFNLKHPCWSNEMDTAFSFHFTSVSFNPCHFLTSKSCTYRKFQIKSILLFLKMFNVNNFELILMWLLI